MPQRQPRTMVVRKEELIAKLGLQLHVEGAACNDARARSAFAVPARRSTRDHLMLAGLNGLRTVPCQGEEIRRKPAAICHRLVGGDKPRHSDRLRSLKKATPPQALLRGLWSQSPTIPPSTCRAASSGPHMPSSKAPS